MTPEGAVEAVDPAALAGLGLSFASFAAGGWREAVHPDDLPGYVARWERALARREAFECEVRLRRDGDAAYRWHIARATPLLDADGRLVRWIGTLSDVTEGRQAEKMAALGALVSGVAHEVRTPLTYVANNLHVLRHRVEVASAAQPSLAPLAKDVAAFVAAAMEGVDRVNNLVRDLRRFADPETGRREYAGLHEVVEGAVNLFRATERGHLVVEADLRPTALVHVDVQQVQRVVLNLLINASEAMPNGGRVRVSTVAVDGRAVLSVADEGPGLAPEVEARMYEPFFTTKKSGLGLGLSICRRIVEAHGGLLRHEANAPRGTTFAVELPCVLAEVQVPVQGAPSATMHA